MPISISSDPNGVDAHLTPRKLEQQLDLAHGVARNWRQRRKGPPYIRIGTRCIRYPVSGVIRWLAEQQASPVSQEKAQG